MEAKRSWRQIKHHPFVTAGIIVVLIALIAFAIGVIYFGWDWTGFTGGASKVTISNTSKGTTTSTVLQPTKTLWDWLGLLGVLAIPAVVGLGTVWFTSRQTQESEANREKRHQTDLEIAKKNREKQQQTDLQIAADNQRETILKEYIDKMSELLLHENLRESKQEHEVRTIARVQTLTTLSRLDNTRKVTILQFLYESKLIHKDKCVIALEGADLYKINLSHANLRGVDLSGAILRRATLGGANLSEANLSKADLWGADFNVALGGFEDLSTIGSGELLVFDSFDGGVEANLSGANLSEAILYGSNVTTKQLAQAQTLKGATMRDGSIHT